MRWQITVLGREKGAVWFERAVDDGSDQRSGTREFESEMFKGVSSTDGDSGCFDVLPVNC